MVNATPAPGKIRVFVALKAPRDWADRLGELQARLQAELRSREIKWVDPEQLHITLRFIGYIQSEELPLIQTAIDRAARDVIEFSFTARTLGCFPTARRPRVLWFGVNDASNHCERLQKEIAEATRIFGEAPEERGFTPHLTLARVKEISREEARVFARILEAPAGIASDWSVSEVLLMQSHLSSAGARYETLHRSTLAARA